MKSPIQHPIQFVWYRAITELQAEASRAYIGILWWIFEPLLYLATFYFVFAVGFRSGGSDFVPFLMVGLVHWKWFSTTVQGGSTALASNQRLLQQVYLPKELLVVTLMIANSLKYCIIFTLLMLMLWLLGYRWDLVLLHAPLLMLVQVALTLGFALLGAAIVPFMPDLKLVIDSGMMVMFFTAGIFYDISQRPEEIQNYLYLNPMARLIDAYRSVLLHGEVPDASALLYAVALALGAGLLGLVLLRRFDRVYPKIVY